jgi:hypothetical protein
MRRTPSAGMRELNCRWPTALMDANGYELGVAPFRSSKLPNSSSVGMDPSWCFF